MRISLDGMNMRISLNNEIKFDEIEVLESDLMEWKYENAGIALSSYLRW